MKMTGMTRPIDSLGRIVIPKEIRNAFDITEGDRLEIHVDGDAILLHKYSPCCIFCGEKKDLISYDGKNICRDCATAIGNEAQ